MKSRNNHQQAFTLIEIMVVVMIIGLLISIAVPNFVRARETARAQACVANLRQIDNATQQYLMDYKISSFPSYTVAPGGSFNQAGGDLTGYLRSTPQCPAAGTYQTGNGGTSNSSKPTCSIGVNAVNSNWSHALAN